MGLDLHKLYKDCSESGVVLTKLNHNHYKITGGIKSLEFQVNPGVNGQFASVRASAKNRSTITHVLRDNAQLVKLARDGKL